MSSIILLWTLDLNMLMYFDVLKLLLLLLLTLSHLWPVGNSLNWLLCPYNIDCVVTDTLAMAWHSVPCSSCGIWLRLGIDYFSKEHWFLLVGNNETTVSVSDLPVDNRLAMVFKSFQETMLEQFLKLIIIMSSYWYFQSKFRATCFCLPSSNLYLLILSSTLKICANMVTYFCYPMIYIEKFQNKNTNTTTNDKII